MTEDEALTWLSERHPARVDTLLRFVELVTAESVRQNLVARSTLGSMLARHVVDSAQLLPHAPVTAERWIDIGTGAGFPGLVVAILHGAEVVMIEPRRLRVEFLKKCVATLGLDNARVEHCRVEAIADARVADVISARAVMALDALFDGTTAIRNDATKYILPKGASAASDVYEVKRHWHGTFHVERSVVDPNSGIVIAEGVSRR